MWVPRFPPTSQKHASGWIGYTISPLGVNECRHGTLGWTDVLVYYRFATSIPQINHDPDQDKAAA